MRWRASSRLRARIDFALTVKKYHGSRPRKARSWTPVAGEARRGEAALQGKFPVPQFSPVGNRLLLGK